MYSIDIKDLKKYKEIDIEVSKGEVLVFSNLLLHKSNSNNSNKVRVTVQSRLGSFLNKKSIKKGWPHGNFRTRWFYDTHPEKIIR